MPTYAYTCKNCAHEFELRATIKEKEENSPDIFKCPECGSSDISQLFDFIAFVQTLQSQAPNCGPGCVC